MEKYRRRTEPELHWARDASCCGGRAGLAERDSAPRRTVSFGPAWSLPRDAVSGGSGGSGGGGGSVACLAWPAWLGLPGVLCHSAASHRSCEHLVPLFAAFAHRNLCPTSDRLKNTPGGDDENNCLGGNQIGAQLFACSRPSGRPEIVNSSKAHTPPCLRSTLLPRPSTRALLTTCVNKPSDSRHQCRRFLATMTSPELYRMHPSLPATSEIISFHTHRSRGAVKRGGTPSQ